MTSAVPHVGANAPSPPNSAQTSTSVSAPVGHVGSSSAKFTSYADYLESIVDRWPQYKDLSEKFRYVDTYKENTIHCNIMIARSAGDRQQLQGSRPSSEVIRLLLEQKSQMESQEVQIIAVQTYGLSGYGRLAGFLGLEYNIDPAFFHFASQFNTYIKSDEFPECLPTSCKVLVLPCKLVTQVVKCQNSQGQEFSVIIMHFSWNLERWTRYDSWLVNDGPSLHSSSYSPAIQMGQRKDYISYYSKILDKWHLAEPQTFNNNPSLYLGPIVKVMAQDLLATAFQLRNQHRRRVIKASPLGKDKDQVLSGKVFLEEVAVLSSEIFDFELFIRQYCSLFESESQPQSTQHEELLKYIKEVLDDGSRVVRLIREQMQAEISLWSIEESRRSIEEAISVKRLTQLAFVFIPLSFVTSVFGMNVQEISGTGVKIWIFVVTAFIVGGSSIVFWRLIKPVQAWRSKRA